MQERHSFTDTIDFSSRQVATRPRCTSNDEARITAKTAWYTRTLHKTRVVSSSRARERRAFARRYHSPPHFYYFSSHGAIVHAHSSRESSRVGPRRESYWKNQSSRVGKVRNTKTCTKENAVKLLITSSETIERRRS